MNLTCLHFCTSEAWGGLELYASTLMVELNNAGCSVVGVCRKKSKVESFLHSHNIETISLPSYSPASLKSVRFLQSLIQQRDVNVLHVHYHKDVWLASLAVRKDPVRKLFLSIYMGVPRKNDLLHRFIYHRVDGVFTSSQELNSRLPDLYPIPASKVHFLPYGRYVDHYARDESKRAIVRALYGVQPEEVLVGTMVRIDPGKGAMDFARSFSYIEKSLQSNIKYVIVGEPTRKAHTKPNESPFELHCEAYLQELEGYIAAEQFGEKILLAGFQDDVIGYLSAMDVFVFPSRDELYSLVVLDAMCMGLPVVAAQAGGNLQQIENGKNGLLYEVADSKDLAEKISQYVRSLELRKRHGKVARAFVEKTHDMRKTIDRLMEYYSGTN
ncbi:MAG: glycosyltransferase family 4 protein [Ignavibacteria bacterium]|nr:glycosyltransferase family 4 protein [Ignavibacteria bacterium]MBI3765725.1 glycosyltransferase family 4 protein [Ignavibacteriales bacterium]